MADSEDPFENLRDAFEMFGRQFRGIKPDSDEWSDYEAKFLRLIEKCAPSGSHYHEIVRTVETMTRPGSHRTTRLAGLVWALYMELSAGVLGFAKPAPNDPAEDAEPAEE